jgi:hypothetical protein
VSLSPLECPTAATKSRSIVAVHGLGGHWKQTWIGASDRLWLRDFLPRQLSDSGIKSRIMSYGYDSDTAFSKSVTDIDDAASMLLDRLEGDRQSVDERGRPVVFIAHSLGGIVVKKVRLILLSLPALGKNDSWISGSHSRTRKIKLLRPSAAARSSARLSRGPSSRR